MTDAAAHIVALAHRAGHADPAVERVRLEAAAAAWRAGLDERLAGEALMRRALRIYCDVVRVPCPASLTVSDEVM